VIELAASTLASDFAHLADEVAAAERGIASFCVQSIPRKIRSY